MAVSIVSKSKFKAKALEIFREVERTGEPVIITDRGRPTLRLVPYSTDVDLLLTELRESIVRYDAPLEPVGIEDWDALR